MFQSLDLRKVFAKKNVASKERSPSSASLKKLRILKQSIDQYKIKVVLVFSIQYTFKILKYQYQY